MWPNIPDVSEFRFSSAFRLMQVGQAMYVGYEFIGALNTDTVRVGKMDTSASELSDICVTGVSRSTHRKPISFLNTVARYVIR